MISDNFLPKALFISLVIHTCAVCGNFFVKNLDPKHKEEIKKGVEITYKAQKKRLDVQQRPIRPNQQLDLSSESSNRVMNGGIPVKLAKDDQSLSSHFTMYERRPEPVKALQMTRRVSITPIKLEKMNNPAYTIYNEMVRSRIEEKVKNNNDRTEAGTVYLTFVVDSNGNLRASQIIAEKTTGNQHLQDIALKSLKDASPFPPFLKGMTLPEYPLNIEVQYQVPE